MKLELEHFGLTQKQAEKIICTALKNGGTLAELFFEETDSTQIFLENGKVDRIMDGIDRGAGLRLLHQNHTYYAYTTDLNYYSLNKLADSLSLAISWAISGAASGALSGSVKKPMQDFEWKLCPQPVSEISNYRIQINPRQLSLDKKIDLIKKADFGAREVFPEARAVTAMLGDSFRKILILNSDGLFAPCEKTYLSTYVQVVGEKEGRVESAYKVEGGFAGLEFFDKISLESVGREAARKVKVLLRASPAPSGTMPVVLSSEAGGTMIHEAVGHGLEADLACNGLSVYQNKLGQKVASPLVTVVDDGTMQGLRGSYSYDDEGTASRKNVLIEKGELKSYLVDRLSGLKFDLMATGNGRRESFRHKPIVRMTNTYVAPGKDDPEQILKDTQKGIFVKAMGGGQVNTVTGDFVFAVTEAYLIENGKMGAPIRGATLVGNGPKVLSIVDRVGSDLGFAVGTCGKDGQGAPVTDAQPTMRIPELTVGGEVPMSTYWP